MADLRIAEKEPRGVATCGASYLAETLPNLHRSAFLQLSRLHLHGRSRLPAQKMFALLAVVFLACLPVESYAHEIKAGELVIIHPWMPEPLRGAKAGVVYLKIQNTGQKHDELLGAESAVAESVTVHESKDVGGVVKMQKRDSVDIPPKGEIELKPMAIHLMLTGLKKIINELDMFSITLRFKHVGNVEADVEVTAPRTVHAPHS